MTGVAWPFNETGTTGAPAVTARQLRQQHSSFVAMGTTARPLGGKSGIRPGTPSSVVTITGSGPYTWNAGGFGGVIDGEANVAAGPYTYSFETADTGTIAAAGAAARVDRLDVQISDSDEGDGSGTKSVAVIYTQGAATGGVAPAAPARSHRLALINVPTSGAPTIQWAPDWAGGPGEWTFNTVADRDAYVLLIGASNVPLNQRATVISDATGYNGDYVWSGSIWMPLAGAHRLVPTAGTVAVSPGSATISASGVVAFTLTSAGTVQVNNILQSWALKHRIRWATTGQASSSLALQLCSGGTPHSGASDYASTWFWNAAGTNNSGGGSASSVAVSPVAGGTTHGETTIVYGTDGSHAAGITTTAMGAASASSVAAGTASGFANFVTASDGIQLTVGAATSGFIMIDAIA